MSKDTGADCAFPIYPRVSANQTQIDGAVRLTKREYAAIAAMQGLLLRNSNLSESLVAESAISFADELLKGLEK